MKVTFEEVIIFVLIICFAMLIVYVAKHASSATEFGEVVVTNKTYHAAYTTTEVNIDIVDDMPVTTLETVNHPEQFMITLQDKKHGFSFTQNCKWLFEVAHEQQALQGCISYRLWDGKAIGMYDFKFAERPEVSSE